MKTVTTNLRIPAHLHKELKKSAERNRRSLNAEILFAIEVFLKHAYTDDVYAVEDDKTPTEGKK